MGQKCLGIDANVARIFLPTQMTPLASGWIALPFASKKEG